MKLSISPTCARKKPIIARFLPAIVLLVAGAAQAQTLTAEKVVRLALERPETVETLAAPVDAAEGDLVKARTPRNPVFRYEREGTDGLGGDGAENFYRLERKFDLSGRRSLARRAARARVTAARHASADARAALRAEALRRFYKVLAAKARAAAALALAEHLAELEDAVASRQRAGDASTYDLARVRQETVRAPAQQSRAEADMFAARQRLGALIGGEQISERTMLSGDLLPPPPAPVASLVAQVDTLPRLRALAAQAEAFRHEKKAAGKIMPDVTLGAGVKTFDRVGPLGRTDNEAGVLLSLSVPLPLFDRNQGAYRRASAEARNAAARYALARDRLHAEIRGLANRAAALRQAATEYRNDTRASAAESVRIARVSYEAGEIGVMEAIDTLRAAYEAELGLIALQRDARAAFIALHELIPETEN